MGSPRPHPASEKYIVGNRATSHYEDAPVAQLSDQYESYQAVPYKEVDTRAKSGFHPIGE